MKQHQEEPSGPTLPGPACGRLDRRGFLGSLCLAAVALVAPLLREPGPERPRKWLSDRKARYFRRLAG